ncbi:SnoaL-like domain-containing protein [Halpernia humi]|uniref:SnoaL-like domain-containing protein n=1 Tax=Halpernia humi TaxID=493375 RepID=A0A1H5TDU2_9FLAO|nr:nuclear transport factor 2 family protein [Halpernia humi]SEF60940.1 SnoaL-like domain-containing protein [Halpernia humi]
MKKTTLIFSLFIILLSLQKMAAQQQKFNSENETIKISKTLDDLNLFAAKADFNGYFNLFAENSTFIGTDATEVWNKKEFMTWAEPFFKSKKTWDFTSLKRNITFSSDGKLAWFDELLNTQMKICRGSGVLEKINGTWKIRQYVLSMTIPNDISNEVTKLKSPIEDQLIQKLKSQK